MLWFRGPFVLLQRLEWHHRNWDLIHENLQAEQPGDASVSETVHACGSIHSRLSNGSVLTVFACRQISRSAS